MAGIDSNVVLMLHCNRPDNTKPYAVTFSGNAQLDTAAFKFGTASLLLDGNADYLSIEDSSDWYLATSAFTIDFWVNFNSVAATQAFFCDGTSASNNLRFYWNQAANRLYFYCTSNSTDVIGIATDVSSFAPSQGTWYHIALVRIDNSNSASAWRIFINGVSKNLNLVAGAWNASLSDFAVLLYIGHYFYLNGWIDQFRWSKGVARWSSNFTPPTTAVLSDSNTQLLLNFEGTDGATQTYDSAGGDENGTLDKPITFAGTAQIDTAQSKFGGASVLLDGDSDYLSVPDTTDWSFGAGDFTVDFWVRFNSLTGQQMFFSQYADSNNRWYLDLASTGQLQMIFQTGGDIKGSYITSGSTLSTGEWIHLAFERYGTTGKIFINGQSQTLTETVAFGSNNVGDVGADLRIGSYDGASLFFNGWIDEIRISKGIARWTANFSPRVAEYSTAVESSIKTISGVAYGNIRKVLGVAISSVKKCAGIS